LGLLRTECLGYKAAATGFLVVDSDASPKIVPIRTFFEPTGPPEPDGRPMTRPFPASVRETRARGLDLARPTAVLVV
jgi:hypothetical protein